MAGVTFTSAVISVRQETAVTCTARKLVSRLTCISRDLLDQALTLAMSWTATISRRVCASLESRLSSRRRPKRSPTRMHGV